MKECPTTRQSLLDAMLGGRDDRAWREFFYAYAPMVLAVARGWRICDADADDITARTLEAVHRHFASLELPFDRSKGKFRAWLYGLVKNQLLDAHRGRARRFEREGGSLTEDPPDRREETALDKTINLEWRRNQLARALDEVRKQATPKEFQAFQLYALDRQPVAAVAEFLGIKTGTVYVYKRRMLAKLRDVVERLQQEEG